MAKNRRSKPAPAARRVEDFRHPTATGSRVPDAGAEPFVASARPPAIYRYDSSLAPSLQWDEKNPEREQAEALIAQVLAADSLEAAKAAATKLKAMSGPFLNWAGKAERPNLEVPTLPLFVHERLSTNAIVETLKGHRRGKQLDMFEMFNDPKLAVGEQATRAYEHGAEWSNRMILGDNLPVMNWLLRGENMGGQVQMIYMDPPYGIKYGSNFQPFVRKRDVTHNDDDDLTREPEMVQAYRDTWQVGLHSYLTYLRDRLALARELLHPTGSVFVQIGDENVHLVRSLLAEVFGEENFLSQISYKKAAGLGASELSNVCDYIVWFAKDRNQAKQKYHPLFLARHLGSDEADHYSQVEVADGTRRPARPEDVAREGNGVRHFRPQLLTSQRPAGEGDVKEFTFKGHVYTPGRGTYKTDLAGLTRLAEAGRLIPTGQTLSYLRYHDDFPVFPLTNAWMDIGGVQSRSDPKIYVVQTATTAIQRCILMSTDPGDLVLDPTCGAGTTAYVAEQWGRRWITIDVSRVPLALARQRLLTATFPWYRLKDDDRGPAGGFVYTRKQNRKGEEVGGIVPHVTLKSIANGEPPAEEVLVDRPEQNDDIVRVTGPFQFEAAIPKAAGESVPPVASEGFAARLLDALRRSPKLHFEGNQTVEVHNIRVPAKSLHLSAEGEIRNGKVAPVSFLFGPENGPVTDKQVVNAIREASMKGHARLLVIGLNIQPNARVTIDQADKMGIAAAYLQATPDLLMGDLLKNMRSSQVFSVCGLPEIDPRRVAAGGLSKGKVNGKKPAVTDVELWEVELLGLDVFNPVTMEATHRRGDDVPAWFLDTDYNESCFHVCQAFFPRTGAWDNLKKELKGGYDADVWNHLAGTTSAPFTAGEHRQVAVKVIDDRGNELMVVKPLGGGK